MIKLLYSHKYNFEIHLYVIHLLPIYYKYKYFRLLIFWETFL